MFYREAGQFKTSYAADQTVFPIRQDKIGMVVILLFAAVVLPALASDYMLNSILIPFLVFSLAAIRFASLFLSITAPITLVNSM